MVVLSSMSVADAVGAAALGVARAGCGNIFSNIEAFICQRPLRNQKVFLHYKSFFAISTS